MCLIRGTRTCPEANRRVGAKPAVRLGSMVRVRPTNFAWALLRVEPPPSPDPVSLPRLERQWPSWPLQPRCPFTRLRRSSRPAAIAAHQITTRPQSLLPCRVNQANPKTSQISTTQMRACITKEWRTSSYTGR